MNQPPVPQSDGQPANCSCGGQADLSVDSQLCQCGGQRQCACVTGYSVNSPYQRICCCRQPLLTNSKRGSAVKNR